MTVVIDLAVRGLLLLSLTGLVALALRRRSAALGASLWTMALGGLLVLPIVSTGVPSWRVPVWPAAAPVAAEPVRSSTPAIAASVPAFNVVRTPSFGLHEPVALAEVPSAEFDWSLWILTVLGAVAVLLLMRVVVSYSRMARTIRAASPAGPEWTALADEARAAVGVTRAVPVRVTDAFSVPALAGVWKPVLLLPIEAREWGGDVKRAVLLHELAHAARRDPLSQLTSRVACALYWYLPPVWLGARRAAVLRERACDDIVLAAGVRPSSYAESLLALVRSARVPVSAAAVAMAQASRLGERVEAILNPALRRGRNTRLAIMMTSLALAAATVGLGAVRPVSIAPVSIAPAAAEPATVEVVSPPAWAIGPSRRAAATPAATSQQQSDRLCGGKGLDRSASSIHEDDSTRRWTVTLKGDGCSVEVRAEGQFEFTPDFTDISRIGGNGFFRVDVTDRGVRRQLEIESRGGTLSRTWRIDGRERPYDAEARAWFAMFLIELDRRTAIGVDIRLPLLVRQGGTDAVLKETALMASDYARNRYYEKLPAATKVSAADAVRVLNQAASLTKSDYYLAELVKVYSSSPVPQDANTRKALTQVVDGMTSDYYQATSIETLMGPGTPSSAEVDVLLGLLKRMKSDYYKAEVMTKILRADGLGAAQQAAVASAAATVGSDYYAAEVLTTLARKGLKDEVVRRAYFEAIAAIGSDHYQGEVLGAFLSSSSVTERDLLDAVATTKSIRSDYTKGAMLERIARHNAATARVRTAVVDASLSLSKYYAEQVRRAAGR
jgi:beta-lactamase regulating signal transducer with metallopeptidase domain